MWTHTLRWRSDKGAALYAGAMKLGALVAGADDRRYAARLLISVPKSVLLDRYRTI